MLVFNNEDAELEAAGVYAAAIPVYGVSRVNGLYLRDTLGFQSAAFEPGDRTTWGTVSKLPLRINPPAPDAFVAKTTGFSSRGPIDDFRFLKPDITAPGHNIYGATIAAGGLHPTAASTMSDPSRFISVSGTSFSGPHVAGAAALVREALLSQRTHPPLSAADLRSGAGALTQITHGNVMPQSIVRAALTNTATNIRAADNVTPVPDTDDRSYINDIGSGLVHVMEAVDARAVMGTNNTNGLGGPDEARYPDFLATHSFGRNEVINTGESSQSSAITVTLENLAGAAGAGTYTLSLVDGGGLRGDVTRPIAGTAGIAVALSSASVALGGATADRATFDVVVTVDGRAAPLGLSVAGVDVNGEPATEFLWWVVASGSNGETLRMPFYYRAAARPYPAPTQNPIADDDDPDQVAGVDHDGNYKLSWTYPDLPAEQPCGFRVDEATHLDSVFLDDAEELLIAGENSRWVGAATWISNVHPDTMTLGYAPVYVDQQDASLEMAEALPLSEAAALLSFDSFEDLENDFDYGYVEVSADGSGYQRMATYNGQFSGRREIDLSSFAGKSIKVRFRLDTDLLVSSPLFLGWFIDNIQIETANFAPIASVAASASTLDVTGRTTGTYFYRVAGLFGASCDAVGSFSNVRQINVDAGPATLAPTADFTAAPNPAEVGEPVTFDASASADQDAVGCDPTSDPNQCIVTYEWSFGDGDTASTSDPVTVHAYNAPGTYRALLIVTDNDGETASSERFIEVTEPPPPASGTASGGGHIAVGGGRANFGFSVERPPGGSVSGHLTYDDRDGHTKVQTEEIDSLTLGGNVATFSGPCMVNKVAGFTCTVSVVDNGEPGSNDEFSISISNGYQAGGTLGGGNIQVVED